MAAEMISFSEYSSDTRDDRTQRPLMRNLRTRTYTSVFSGTVLALVFAVLWVCTQSVELWVPSSEVKDGVEAPVTVRLPGNYFRITMLRNEVHYLATASSTCPNVFPRGAKVSAGTECSKVLHAFEAARRPIRPTRLLGSFALFLVVGLLLSAYMRRAYYAALGLVGVLNVLFA